MRTNRLRTRLSHLLIAASLSSCSLVESLDELRGGGTGAAGGGGAGGAGAGGAGVGGVGGIGAGGQGGGPGGQGGMGGQLVALEDWSSAFTAVFAFELPGPELRLDSSGNGNDLLIGPGTVDTTSSSVEGSWALQLDLPGTLTSAASAFALSGDRSFTFGAWLNLSDAESGQVIDKGYGGSGYYLSFDGVNEYVRCGLADTNVRSDNGSTPGGLWKHVVCRHDGDNAMLEVALDGTIADSKPMGPTMWSGVSFQLGQDVAGSLDEVFFVDRAMATWAIRRVYACGIRGLECACRPDDPTEFADCGRHDPICSNLGACNAPPPT